MALSYSELKLIGSRYGAALFDLALEQGSLPAIEDAAAGLEALTEDEITWVKLASNPIIAPEKKLEVITASIKGLPPLLKNFLAKVAENGRLDTLSEIIADFKRRALAHRQETGTEIISAKPLTRPQQEEMTASLKKAGKVAVTFRVDPSIGGGVIIRSGAKMLDYSIRGRLDAMEQALKDRLTALGGSN